MNVALCGALDGHGDRVAAAEAEGGPPQVAGGPPHLAMGMYGEVTVVE